MGFFEQDSQMKAWGWLAIVGLGLCADPVLARDLYLTNASQNVRAYLDVQSIQEQSVAGATVRVFEAEAYHIVPNSRSVGAQAWKLAANCSTPYQVAQVSTVEYDGSGKEVSRVRFIPEGAPFVFEDHPPTSLVGDFWLAACKGESMQLTEHRMFARSPAEVLRKLRQAPRVSPVSPAQK